MRTFDSASRSEYPTRDDDATFQEIQTGCIQRIAAATEAMAKNYIRLQSDNDWLRGRVESLTEKCGRAERSNAALRGVIKKMKKGGAQ